LNRPIYVATESNGWIQSSLAAKIKNRETAVILEDKKVEIKNGKIILFRCNGMYITSLKLGSRRI